ncbi:MAG TPA: M42 family metallopeptidase [Trueperaceae bacterium]
MTQYDFLRDLLQSPGVSSFEGLPAKVWRDQARAYGAEVETDAYGNSFARFGKGGSPRVMLAGHVDEIGLLITYVDDAGLLYFTGVGINEGSGLPGQRVRVVSEGNELPGVIGRKAPHLSGSDDRGKRVKLESLWIDIGARNKEDALKRVQPGSFAVFEAPVIELGDNRWASKAMDDRVGAFVALEAARRASASGAKAEIVAAATTQEEISGVGANVAAYRIEPDLAIALDLTHASDVPDVDKKSQGEIELGKGPVLEVGATVHQGLMQRLRECAEKEGVPYQRGFSGRRTATDADDIAKVRSGAPTILVSVPNRYMHSPVEIVDLNDVEGAIKLLERFIVELEGAGDLYPRD